MNIFKTIRTAFLAMLISPSFALTVDELKVSYEAQVLRVKAEREDSLDQLRESYLKSLAKMEEGYQKAGRLQDVLQVRKEKEAIENKIWPLPNLGEKAPADLKNGRRLYDRSHSERERKAAGQFIDMAAKMETALEKKVTELTKQGKIEEAKEARQLIEQTKTHPNLTAAIDLMARVGRDGSASPAYRLRRFGDGIEVVVSYDKSGQLSMDSPVANVIEITGEKQERGTTKAKVLGEFVGARGYVADPWIVYENKLVTGELGNLNLTALKADSFAKTDDGQTGLKITMSPNPLNPHMALREALPPIAEAGQYQVDFSYYIPSDNKKIIGFAWHQGFGAPIENKFFDKKGRWTTETLQSKSLNEMHFLRLYLTLEPGVAAAAAAGESIYLKDLKLAQLAFSAYLVAKYNRDGGVDVSYPNAADQKKLIVSGAFVPEK